MLIYLLLFCLGISLGSFSNVLIYRYPIHQRFLAKNVIGGRSYCPQCRHFLKWFELIPLLSFVIQKRRCRNCKQKISWRYFIVELIAGLAAALIYWRLKSFYIFGFWWFFAIWLAIFFILLLISLIDRDTMLIPNGLNFLLLILGLALYFVRDYFIKFGLNKTFFLESYAVLFGNFRPIFLNYFLTAIAASLFFFLIILVSRERAFGMGDAKLIFCLGLLFGWPDTLILLNLSFVLGSIFVLPALIMKKKSIKDKIPFGPFLGLASFIFFAFGNSIFNLLFSLL